MMISKNPSMTILSRCSLLFRQMTRYAAFFRLADAFSQISLTRTQITTICNRSIPDQINRTPLASTASSSWMRKIGKRNMRSATTQIYQRNICCSLLRCIHQRRTISIRRFIAVKRDKIVV